ncbi:MAG: DUF5667 domain-containing protein [bacterium]
MIKKILIVSGILVGAGIMASQTTIASSLQKPGILPDSPFYALERASESINNLFTPSNKKAERFFKLAGERLAEANALNAKGQTEKASQAFNEYQKLIDRAWMENKKTSKSQTTKTTETRQLTNLSINRQTALVENYKKAPDKLKPQIKSAIEAERKKALDIISNLPDAEKTTAMQNYKVAENPLIDDLFDIGIAILNNPQTNQNSSSPTTASPTYNTANPTTNNQTAQNLPQAVLNAPTQNEPQAALNGPNQQIGKPGMNETGSTQVVSPKNSGNCCTKLYLCKIECGKKIIADCNGYSADKMYDLLNCRGACTHYNLFYGCGMEAGCDTPCWNNYDSACSMNTYEQCLSGCDDVFGDCN